VPEPLPDAYLLECELRARKFSGAYTGTSGTLAADVLRLLEERRRLLSELALVVAAAGKAENYECWPDR
jgi:hypothetical protein